VNDDPEHARFDCRSARFDALTHFFMADKHVLSRPIYMYLSWRGLR
jgi:hypothetical protein